MCFFKIVQTTGLSGSVTEPESRVLGQIPEPVRTEMLCYDDHRWCSNELLHLNHQAKSPKCYNWSSTFKLHKTENQCSECVAEGGILKIVFNRN